MDEEKVKEEVGAALENACLEALGKVVDPELGLDIVSLGLVYKVKSKEGVVEVDLTMTSPGCPLADEMVLEANNELLRVPGVNRADVNLVWSPPWGPEKMSDEAKMILGF